MQWKPNSSEWKVPQVARVFTEECQEDCEVQANERLILFG
jgi:hypothetical protein